MNNNINGLLNMNIKNFALTLVYKYYDDLLLVYPDELWICDD